MDPKQYPVPQHMFQNVTVIRKNTLTVLYKKLEAHTLLKGSESRDFKYFDKMDSSTLV